jgi:predicted ribosome quality control (RQC) complex YloA/Tae2 family protein
LVSISGLSIAHLHDIAQIAENALIPPPPVAPAIPSAAYAEVTTKRISKMPKTKTIQKEQVTPLVSTALRQALDLVAKLERERDKLQQEIDSLQSEIESLRQELELEKTKRKVITKAAAVVVPEIRTVKETKVVTIKEQTPPEIYHVVYPPRPEDVSRSVIFDDEKTLRQTRVKRLQKLGRLIHLIDATAA